MAVVLGCLVQEANALLAVGAGRGGYPRTSAPTGSAWLIGIVSAIPGILVPRLGAVDAGVGVGVAARRPVVVAGRVRRRPVVRRNVGAVAAGVAVDMDALLRVDGSCGEQQRCHQHEALHYGLPVFRMMRCRGGAILKGQ